MKKYCLVTFGCQMNLHDSEKMSGILDAEGFTETDSPAKADIIIFNTCSIRHKAEQKFFSFLGRMKSVKKKRPGVKIAVAGCIAQDAKTDIFRRAPHVDYILGPQNIHLINDIISNTRPKASLEDNADLAFREFEAKRQSSSRAWVSIMYGCNNFCSYCIVPYTRGREVSRPADSIVSEVSRLHADGYKEVTLLGQNVNSYRNDIGFPELLRRVDKTGIARVRFVTSHPRDLSDDLIHTVPELSSVCEHLHLPLQSGSDRVLRLMNRGYTYDEYTGKIAMLRKSMPGTALTTDIIVGFPGETDGDYMRTLKALEEIEYDGIFAFKYSPRRGTKAFAMEDRVSEDIKTERLSAVLKMQEEITHKKNISLDGTIQEVLLEGPSDTDPGMLTGRTRTNKIVTIPDSGEAVGSLVLVKIERARPHSLSGTKVSPVRAIP
jgi:tRNA-2-methylthio-N6-dimethylallyladenosine synthase